MLRKCKYILIFSLFTTSCYAQTYSKTSGYQWSDMIAKAPDEVFTKFEEAGLKPTEHILSKEEKAIVLEAFSALPPLHREVLMKHLSSISFMDNMPNTALTSKISNSDSPDMYNITFRAGILKETISEWATWKENTYYTASDKNSYRINVEAGDLNAIQYVMLHEATHIVDATSNINKKINEAVVLSTSQVWEQDHKPKEKYIDSTLNKSRFRSGKINSISLAPEIYKSLQKTPFVSLYATAAKSEDIAELMAIYHLTQKLGQPYRLTISEHGREIASFEPMKNKIVMDRFAELAQFY